MCIHFTLFIVIGLLNNLKGNKLIVSIKTIKLLLFEIVVLNL